MIRLKYSGLIMVICWLLLGCSTDGKGIVSVKKPVVQKATPAKQTSVSMKTPVATTVLAVPDAQSSAMESCSRELKALRRLDAQLYSRRKAQFDRLMSNAAIYAGLRTDVAGSTREAVDAMYRFRTSRLCAEISRDVLDALAR
ncbi:hypothetical protein EHB58_24000 [Salmonella enterica subsp. enterica serovar Hull]|uniref:Lipoprotein n=1 Tax=Salmonella enterica subsp. enterica serovar Hull TaxID=1403564 RepID=A0A5X4PLP1_SALET|nr:hypothetical protein [Salmonella enterica subsp. enterica serovar Putten]EBZ7588771.1 hypothetical protein [Salmonella enterica subsp. enterica serovar Hull]EBZ8651197.1 hypothetical protein [Salmonella enterica subsp. enterica serovar Hull]EEB7450869.1 hypothetical protein [Salmonella enterica subsp. enterica serovar Emek]